MISAWRSAKELRSRARLPASARMARSVSRLNSAAPYNTQAWPPISRARTRCAWIEERTLRIGFGIKRASQHQVALPEFLALPPTLERMEAVPLRPLLADQILCLYHDSRVPQRAATFKWHPISARGANQGESQSCGARGRASRGFLGAALGFVPGVSTELDAVSCERRSSPSRRRGRDAKRASRRPHASSTGCLLIAGRPSAAEGRLESAIPPTTRAAETSRRSVMTSSRISQLRNTPKSGVVRK